MSRDLRAWVLLAVLPLSLGCACAHGGNDAILATIGDVPVTQSEFERYVRAGMATASVDEIRTNEPARNTALEGFFDLQVMAAKARQDGIDREPRFQKASQLMEMKLLVKAITDRDRPELLELAKDPTGAGKRAYMERINAEVGLQPTDLATDDSPLVFTWLVDSNAVVATLGETQILESDFQWFLKDAFRPEQRPYVFGRPGARQELMNSYLSMRALAAKARKDGLDQEAAYLDTRAVMLDKLLAEFLLERDRMMPWHSPGDEQEQRELMRAYLDQLRSELKLQL